MKTETDNRKTDNHLVQFGFRFVLPTPNDVFLPSNHQLHDQVEDLDKDEGAISA